MRHLFLLSRPLGTLTLIAALAGCVMPVAGSSVTAARLTATDVVVTVSDGRTCRTPWAAGAGRMDPCGVDWQVVVEDRPNPLRKAVTGLADAVGLEVTPMAVLSVTGPDGVRREYVSPPPVDMGD